MHSTAFDDLSSTATAAVPSAPAAARSNGSSSAQPNDLPGLRPRRRSVFAEGGAPATDSHSRALPPHRDSRAWRLQVWVSFGIAVLLCATGLAYLPGQDLDRAFMVMGYLFCLSMVFVLAKAVRDRAVADRQPNAGAGDQPLWQAVVWGGFAASMALTAWGLLRMGIDPTYKAFLAVGWCYLVSSAFTLAKTLRDGHEADLAEARSAGFAAAAADAARRGE